MDFLKRLVHEKLAALASGKISPDDVAPWALDAMESDSEELEDSKVWDALDLLAGADLLVGPGEYLHGSADFDRWLADFEEE